MRQILSAVILASGLVCTAQIADAQSVLHQWPVTETSDEGTVLTAQGSASGRGLTLTIAAPIPLEGRTAETLFYAEIERQMAEANILDRDDRLRISGLGLSVFVTGIEYETNSPGEKRIALFAVNRKDTDTTLRVIRADGPFDHELMEHYAGDILSIAENPDAAIAGKLKVDPHPDTVIKTTPDEKKPGQISQQTLPFTTPATPQGWGRKVYTDAARYWPTTGPIPRGGKTGYIAILIYNPVPLNGKPVKDALTDFTTAQESEFDVQRRDIAITDGPYRAWDYLRSKTVNDVYLNVSYLAIQTGEDSMRVVREMLTDDDYTERDSYARAIGQLYRHIESETVPAFRAKTAAATTMQLMTQQLQTESRSERRQREKSAKAAARADHIQKVSSESGKGIPLSDIAGVFLRSDFLERAYGGRNAEPSIYIFLKDSTVYVNPTRPPSDISIAGSLKYENEQWKQWRKSGDKYQVRDNSSAPWKTIKGAMAKPAPGTTIGFNGKHIAAWGDVLSGSAGHRTGSIKLTKSGRYETSSFAMAGGSGITGLPAATVSTSTGKSGRQSTTSSNVAPALINSVKRDPDGTDFTGQYALKGYTAEFLSDSGKLNRTLFLIDSEGGVYVGGRYYSVPDE